MVGHAVSAGSSAAHPWFGDSSLNAGAFVQRAISNVHSWGPPRLTLGLTRQTRCIPNANTGKLEPLGRRSHA